MKNKFSIAMTLAVVMAMLITSLAFADQVVNNIDITINSNPEVRSITVGGSTSVGFFIQPSNTIPSGDASGCNATGATPATVTLSIPAGVTASTTSLTFTGCGIVQNVTFSSSVANVSGYTISVFSVTGGKSGSGWDTSTADFKLVVSPPADSTPPVLSLPAPITVEATSSSGATVSFTATANDAVDGSVPVTCTPASGSTFPLGTTTVNCSAQDAAGNTGSGSFTITVVDTTAPSISGMPGNITKEATSAAGATANYTSPTANDIVDGAVAVTCTPASGSTFALGTTTVTCSATDAHGNTASNTFNVTVVDTTAPSLVGMPSDLTVEGNTVGGADVNFTAPTATDTVDANPSVSCSANSGDFFPLGTTTVTCTATDASDNSSSDSFDITVVDTTAPSISGTPSNITKEATSAAGAAASYTSPTANDIVDGSVAVTCSPASGSTFPLGPTTVNCSASDASGNTASSSFMITVVDTTPPTVNVPANITAEATGPSGAAVTFTATASDIVDGVIAPTCSPLSGSTFGLDATTAVTCSATDAHGNTGSASFSVTVVDTTAPSVTVPANITTGPTGALGANVTYSGASATDLVDGSVAVSCSPASGSLFTFGTTTVICTATDAHGNSGSANFSVTVTGFNFLGFFQPVDNNMLNTVRNGSTVPVKWKLQGQGGMEITSTAAVTSIRARQLSCSSFVGLTEDTIETLTSGNSILRYDATAMQFVYNWQTYRQANTCWQLIVSFTDGTSQSANFKLK